MSWKANFVCLYCRHNGFTEPWDENAFFNLASAQIWDERSHFSAEATAELLCFASALDESGVCCEGKALAWATQKTKKNKTKTLSHKIRAQTAAAQTCTRTRAQTTQHVFINWRTSQTRTSAELINNNLDKLSLSDHSARPNNRTTDETIAAGPETWATALWTIQEKKGGAGPEPSCLRRGHCDSWPKGNLDRVVQ